MAGLGDHHLPHVLGRGAHHDGHGRPEGGGAADRQHRHRQLAAGEEGLVVLRILVEGGELFEAGMHGAGQGVERGVVLARSLAEAGRVGGELVPEAVEVDPLPPRHQAFRIRPLEGEMPERPAADDLLPRADAGQRRVHDGEAGDPLRVLRRQRIADHVADVVGDQRRPRDAERIEQPGHVLPLGLLVVAALGPPGVAHAAQVGDDDAVRRGQFRRERRPHVAGLAIAVQQQHGGPVAAGPHMQGGAVGGNAAGLRNRRGS